MTDSTLAFPHGDPNHLRGMGESVVAHDGPAPKRIVTGYGFWIFLLSDIVMFSCFFASYAVLVGQTAGGPRGSQLFSNRWHCSLFSGFCTPLATLENESFPYVQAGPLFWRFQASTFFTAVS